MRNYLIAGLIALGSLGLNAQETTTEVKKGDVYEIIKPSGNDYKYINFPRKNIIIKRGGIVTNQLVDGKKIVVTKVIKEDDGSTTISVKTTNGSGFYKAIKSVTIDYEKALNSGEIKVSKL
jgi:hypothetical protein